MAKRIQRKRTRGWEAPLDEHGRRPVYVGRGSRWGNPIRLDDVAAQYPSLDPVQVATLVVRDFESLSHHGRLYLPNWRYADGTRGPLDLTYPPVEEIRSELAGRDLMCWCRTEDDDGNPVPCHATILLEIANA